MTDADRIRAAGDRACAAMQAHRLRPGEILVETAPLYFPSRPAAPMPDYMHPDFADCVLARLQRRAPAPPSSSRDADLPATGSFHV